MPVMETDIEDPEYLPRKWESAVAAIIAAVDNTTLSALDVTNITAAGEATLSATVVRAAAAVPVSKAVAPNSTFHPGYHVADAVVAAKPTRSSVAAGGDTSAVAHPAPFSPEPADRYSAPPLPSPSTIVVPILVPYLVPGPGVQSDKASSPPALPPPISNSTNSSKPDHNATVFPPKLPFFHPDSVGSNFTFNQTVGGSPTPPPFDAAAAVGWSFLSLILILVCVALFALGTSKRLRAWCRLHMHWSRYMLLYYVMY